MTKFLLPLALALAPCAVYAQDATTATGWNGLNRSALSTVYVTDDRGTETKGKLLRLDPEAIVLLVDGTERRFDAAQVRRVVKRGDSLKNGAIAGAVVGAVLSGMAAAVSDCPGARDGCPGARVAMAIGGLAFYTTVGVGIDAMIQGRTTLYEAPVPRTGSTTRGATVSLRVTW